MITATAAKILQKQSKLKPLPIELFLDRMWEEIRKAAKKGRNIIIVDIIDYAFGFNYSLAPAANAAILQKMQSAAIAQGFMVKTICDKGEYAFTVSWAEN